MTATAPRQPSVLPFTRNSLPRSYTRWLADQPTRTKLSEGLQKIGLGDQAEELVGILSTVGFGSVRIGACTFAEAAKIWKVLRLGSVDADDVPWLKRLLRKPERCHGAAAC